MSFKVFWIRTIAKHAAASPALRRTLIGVLNRVPTVKRRMKRALAHANTLASQGIMDAGGPGAEDALLSRQARRTLADLRQETERIKARRAINVKRR